jgi:DNA-binding response OmpR family regulator
MSKKILVIEDEENLAKLIQAFLTKNGYQVTTISDGINSLEDIRKEAPDLILTDLLLPRIHGFDICRSVKSDYQLKELPLIIMTAVYKNAIHKLEARKLGIQDFVEKPLNLDELLEKIQHFLGPGQAVPITAPPPTTRINSGTVPRVVPPPSKTSPAQAGGQIGKIPVVKETEMKQQMQVLQENYAGKLPGRIVEMEKLWESILLKQNTSALLTKLRREVHSLTGSGATFGFKEISDIARDLELLLDMIISEGEATIDSRKEKIYQLLDNMRHHPIVSTELEIIRQGKGI